MSSTPAAKPSNSKYNISKYPIIGPKITRPIEENIAFFIDTDHISVKSCKNNFKDDVHGH